MNSISSSSLRRNWIHHVFPSFHGADVRRSFLSHILKELKSKGIDSFSDNGIVRGEFIGPELKKAIQGSRIAIVLISRRYASSSWCLDELTEIMKCKKESGQTVIPIFYEVDPTDVKKQAGEFGEVFTATCKGKTNEVIGEWSQALAEVATIAGYDSKNWPTEAEMIETIVTDVSNKLIISTRSRDFDGFVGMAAHMEKIKPFLCVDDSNEVTMIGIWGPAGIGKSTIARCLFNEHSSSFDLSVFMDNIKGMDTLPVSSDNYNAKLHLQQKFMSQIINEKDIKITHLGVAQERLNDKRVLVVLDDVDKSVQLEAMAKKTWWFGPGSRIVITTQNLKLLKAHGINNIYKVDFPPDAEALEIFCMYAFDQKSPKDGFEKLAWEVTRLAGNLPLGLRVMGSFFRGLCEQEWLEALPSLRNSLDGDIETILMFSYDALTKEEKLLFLHLACYFNLESVERVEYYLSQTFNIKHGLRVLDEKSLISTKWDRIEIHSLLLQLGRKIVRDKSESEPGERQFLIDVGDICEVLSDDTGSRSVIGIDLTWSNPEEELDISERAFERMSNLQFLKIYGERNGLCFPQSLNSISGKLIYLVWTHFPMKSLPSNFNPKSLVQLDMTDSNLEMLWEGTRPLKNLKWMDLTDSINLKKLPDLSTATSLEVLHLDDCSSLLELPISIGNAISLRSLDLSGCSSLVKLPSTIGNATNLTRLRLYGCSRLVELPSSIGNATKLEELSLANCTSLVELPFSIGNLQKLWNLVLKGCSKLKVLPININMEALHKLYLIDCSLLKTFPEISTNIKHLELQGTVVEEVPLAIRSWSCLEELHMSYSENLKDLPHALDSITVLHLTNTEIQELGPWVKGFSRLHRLVLNGMQRLVSLPQLPDSLLKLDAENCKSLERLDCSFHNPYICLNFLNCFKLNQEARDHIIRTSNRSAAILPGGEVPAYFSDRATGGTLTVKLNESSLHTSSKFKACIVLIDKADDALRGTHMLNVSYKIMDKQNGLVVPYRPSYHALAPAVTGHLYTFEFEVDVTSNDLSFELQVGGDSWAVKECGILQLSQVCHVDGISD